MRNRGGKISIKGKTLFISVLFIVFAMIGSVAATDINNENLDNLNLAEGMVFEKAIPMENLEVSSNNSISETNSHDVNLNNYQNDVIKASDFEDNESSVASDVNSNTYIIANNISIYYHNGTKLVATLFDENGSSIANQTLIFNINGVDYNRTTGDNGSASMSINLNPGSYFVQVKFNGTDKYNTASTNCTVEVLSTIKSNDIVKYYKNGTQFYVTVLNGAGEPAVGEKLTFNINGVFYSRTTNENGTARLNINLPPDTYVITTETSKGERKSNNVTVLSTIISNDLVKYYKNGTQFCVTVLNGTGEPAVGEKLKFNINGVFYSRTTNENGTAKLNINLPPDTYVITTETENGEKKSNNVTVLSTIISNDLVKYYKNGTQFYVTVLNGTGEPAIGENLTFNINGVFYSRTTNENGTAKLNINLAPASYTITTETSKGEKKSNNVRVISVDPIIHGSDIQGFVNRDINFTVNLAYPNGEPIYDQNIIANINNNKYEAKTNEYGVATFNIKGLDIGNYTINYHYDGYIGFNPCKGSNTIKVVNSTSIFVADDLYIVYGNSSKFPVTLLNLTGIPLAGEVVTFYINGVDYNRTTDEDGIAKMNINLMPGNYTISYTYSTPDKTDYASGSNRIFISKNPGHLIANNTEVNYGENIHFVVNGYDSNNKPVNNANVLITVDGKDYNLNLVNGSGYYDFNLPVGVNEIYYQFDDLLYSSNVGTNNLTVKGYKLIGNDITVSKGSTSFFEVLVTDTYDNPISNKGVEFTILGNTITNNTDDYGIAKILLPSLTEDTIISYCYSENKTFKGENKISIRPDVDFKDIMIASVWLKNFIEDNFLVPDYVNVGGTDYTTAQFLYMLSEVTVRMSRGEFSGKVSVVDVQDPINPSSSTVQGNLYTYSDLASNIIDFIKNNGIAPDSMDTSIGKSGYDPIVYALTRVVAFYYNNGVLPSYVSLKSASSVIPYSVLDDVNTIVDVSPYLDPTKNCQVNDGRIQALASQLTSGKTSDWAKAVAIYNYVRDRVSYSFYYNSRYGAYNTLFVSGTANCCDQANAVIALFRAAGLPARYVHGYCTFSSGSYGHVWAQVLIGDTWVVADPTSNRNSLGIVVNWNNYNYDLYGKYRELSF